MTDRFENIRKALDVIDECADGTLLMTRDRCARLRKAADTIRELLAERDALLEACCLAARYLNPDQFPDAVKKIDAAIAAANGGGNG